MRQFFGDDKGSLSMTRLCTFLLVSGGIALAFVHPEYETLSLGMIMLGLGGKVGQKYLEVKKN